MCYSSHRDFGQRIEKDVVQEPEGRRETMPEEHPEPKVRADRSRVWAFLHRERRAWKSAVSHARESEKV